MLLFLVSRAFAVDPLLNAGFETGDFSSWNVWGDQTLVVAEAYEGAYAAQLSLDPGIDGFQESGMYQDVLGAAVGERLELAVMARALPADPLVGTGVLLLGWETYGPDDASDFGTVEVALSSDGAWSEGTVAFVVGEGMETVRFVLLLDGETLGADGTVQVDDLRLVPVVDDDTGTDTDTDPPAEGCGCTSAPRAPLGPFAGLILLWRRRRAGPARRGGGACGAGAR